VTLVDSNVLIDVLTDDPRWFEWSKAHLDDAGRNGPLIINDVIYAETSIRYENIASAEIALERAGVGLVVIPRVALFVAGRAFLQYRRAGGTRTGVLPDFFIGAHAEVEHLPLLTRDPRRYRTYFPGVTLIAPTLQR
jgi:predicted nucleic acid-binding protein